MEIKLHDTLTRQKRVFEPIDRTNVRMYLCGPTVYDRIHVGNARPMVVFDLLFRLLRHNYGADHVTYVRNLTDIEDKIIVRARDRGMTIEALTEQTAQAFFDDVEAIKCLVPSHQPRATDYVAQMIELSATLIEKGHAYHADGHVLFEVATDPSYGKLSGRSRDEQVAGARVEVAPYKRDAADFVLWKPSSDDEPGWDSPWGKGRPGWHIECSAMSESLLGLPFDIHGGGIDLVFPHHENEIAQSCCGRSVATMANFWMHNGFVDLAGEKMSKSTGNLLSMAEALAMTEGETLRAWLLSAHYRQPLDFSDEAFGLAKKQLDRFYSTLERASGTEAGRIDPGVVEALADDLNTPKAFAVLHEIATAVNRGERPAADLKASAGLLGFLQDDPQSWLKGDDAAGEIEQLIGERRDARKARDFARADAIRDQLDAMGVLIEDGAEGTSWRRKS